MVRPAQLRAIRVTFGLVLTAVLALVQPASAVLTWSREVVDDPTDSSVGYFNALALDSSGRPHIAYFDFHNRALKYAKRTSSGAWRRERIEGPPDSLSSVGMGVSLAIDSNGTPHVSYYAAVDSSGGDLHYAKRICVLDLFCSWVKETVDDGVFSVAGSTSIAVDTEGTPHISYFDYVRHQLKWARREPSGWGIANVAPTIGGYTSLALDANELPHIAFSDDGTYPPAVRYAKVTCAFIICGWQIETLDEGVLGDLKLDGNGRAHLTYRGDMYTVKYAIGSCPSSGACSWNRQTISSTSDAYARPALALTTGGAPRVAFVSGVQYGYTLVYMWRLNGLWMTQSVDAPVLGNSEVSLALDSSNKPHVSYAHYPAYSLRYAKGSPLVMQPLTSSGSEVP
jgi:hypothetical protein